MPGVRRVSLIIVTVLALASAAGCGSDEDSGPDADGAVETSRIETQLVERAGGGVANCVRFDAGERFECLVETGDGEQSVDVSCGDGSGGECIYKASQP